MGCYYTYTTHTPIRKAVSFAQPPCRFPFPVRGSRSLVWSGPAVCCRCVWFRITFRLFAGVCIVIRLLLSWSLLLRSRSRSDPIRSRSCPWSGPVPGPVPGLVTADCPCSCPCPCPWSGPVPVTYSNCAAMLASLASCYTLNIIIYSYRINTDAIRYYKCN